MTGTITRAIGQAMAEQTKRVNNDPVRLRQIIAEQEQTIKRLQALIQAQHTAIIEPEHPDQWEQIGFRHYCHKQSGREAGTQVELARRLGKKPYDVCKWVRAGRLVTVQTPDDRESVWLDQSKPTLKQRSKKVR